MKDWHVELLASGVFYIASFLAPTRQDALVPGGFDPFARGSQNEVGLSQTHPIHAWAYPDAWPLAVAGDIEAQVAIMHNQWEGSGWKPWIAQRGRCW